MESIDFFFFAYSHFKQFLLGRRWFLVRLLRFLLDRRRVGLQAKLWRLRHESCYYHKDVVPPRNLFCCFIVKH